MNNQNFDFYNKLGVDPFKQLAIIGGFNTCMDMELAYPYFNNARTILEIGAGYGRCIDYLLEKGFEGKIIALEQSHVLFDHLKKNYNHPQIEILPDDFKKFNPTAKIDSALWMWSGIIDFSREEQEASLIKISSFLSEKGCLVIDIPRLGFKTYAEHKDDQHLHLDSPYGTLDCYVPSREEINQMSKRAGFTEVVQIDYKTRTEKERTLYVLLRP